LKMCYKKIYMYVNQLSILVRIWSDRADMAKGLAPIFFTTCGVVVAGIIGYAIINPSERDIKPAEVVSETTVDETKPSTSSPASDALEEEAKKPANQAASLEPESTLENKSDSEPVSAPQNEADIEVKTKSDERAVELTKPSFDVVRVERDGSAVIAGRAGGNQKVELVDGEKKIADATTSANGEFVIALDKPLAPGAHELFIRTVPESGEAIQSSSFAFVEVPEKNSIGSATVLLAELGKPSQVIQKPEPETGAEPVNVVSNTAKESVSIADPDQQVSVQGEPEPVEEQTTQTALVNPDTALDNESSNTEPKTEVKPVLIEAADVEKGKIFIAGTGEPGGIVNLYMDNEFLGSTEITENGAFLFEGRKEIEAGRYEIRADMTNGSSPNVIARAEVDLVHEPQVIAANNENEPESAAKIQPEPAPAAEVEVKAEPVVNEEAIATSDLAKDENKNEDVVAAVPQTAAEPENADGETKTTAQIANTEQKGEIRTGSAVIIRRGDNLWTVARRNYGAGIRYTTIFEANRDQIRNPHRIYPGQVLKVPEE